MNTVFSNKPVEVLTGIDNVIIPQLISAIPGGRTLDMTGFGASTISAGWVIITDGNGNYKPLGTTDAYALTTDTAIDSTKTYYTESSGVYTAVASPAVADIATYYEKKEGKAYEALPSGWNYAGILAHSLLASKPAATILTAGQVNEVAAPNGVSSVKSAITAAIPTIQFIKEENA